MMVTITTQTGTITTVEVFIYLFLKNFTRLCPGPTFAYTPWTTRLVALQLQVSESKGDRCI